MHSRVAFRSFSYRMLLLLLLNVRQSFYYKDNIGHLFSFFLFFHFFLVPAELAFTSESRQDRILYLSSKGVYVMYPFNSMQSTQIMQSWYPIQIDRLSISSHGNVHKSFRRNNLFCWSSQSLRYAFQIVICI